MTSDEKIQNVENMLKARRLSRNREIEERATALFERIARALETMASGKPEPTPTRSFVPNAPGFDKP